MAVYFQPRRFTDGVDDQAQHVAAIGMKGRRRIVTGVNQLAAQAKDRRVAVRDDTECIACIAAGQRGANRRRLRGWREMFMQQKQSTGLSVGSGWLGQKQKAPITKVGAFLVSGLGGSR